MSIVVVTGWTYNDRPEGARFLTDRIPEPGRTAIEDALWAWIVRGVTDADEFVHVFDDEDERCGATDEELAAAYTKALAARREQQRGWGEVRGNLTRAFAELNELGVVAREDFGCCGSCASAEIDDECDESRHWHGYLFYHQQDTGWLVASEDGEVYLGYDAYPTVGFDEAAFAELSEADQQASYRADLDHLLDTIVFPVLRRHGLRVEWDRDPSRRIRVTGAQWYAPLA